MCDSHLTWKVANKCLNVREWVEVVEWNKKWSPPFPRCPMSRQCPWKKTLIEKKEPAQLVPFPFSWGRSTRYFDRLHDFPGTISRCYKDFYVNSFFPLTARLWNSLPIECFPLTYNLNGFKSRINKHLLTVGSFWRDFLYALIFLCFFLL